MTLAFIGLAIGILAAIWAADVATGIIPDVFTLFPLAAIVLADRPRSSCKATPQAF